MLLIGCFTYNAARAIFDCVIRSFRDRDTRVIFNREWIPKFESIANIAHCQETGLKH